MYSNFLQWYGCGFCLMETVDDMASLILLILVIILLQAYMKHAFSNVVGQCAFKYANIASKMSQCLQFLKMNGDNNLWEAVSFGTRL